MTDSSAPSEVPRWEGSADPERAALALAEAALDLPPETRRAWLTTACAPFPHLQPRVESLIEASELAESCGESPPFLVLLPVDDWAAQLAAPFSTGAGPTRLAAGATFGRYRIERFVAAGGMGEVYEARDDALGRRVAIKVLSAAATASRSRRFVYEAGLMARLEHPGIARLYEWSEADLVGVPTPFIAMEFIDGRPISEAARDLPDARARADLCMQVCEAVEYAHSRGVIHRDLKPANILVDGEGRARVLDFGIGSLLDPAARSNLSITEGAPRPGTLAYMSPEQLRGGAESISTLSDVYSLGLVLYEVLAGRPALPFRDEPIDAIIRSVLEEDPPALGRVAPECRSDLEAIVSFALRKDPKARYASAAALGEDLARYLRREHVRARRPGAWEQAISFARRRRALTASLSAAALAMSIGLTVAAVQYRRAIDAERVAQQRLEEARALAKALLFDFTDAIYALPGSAPVRAMLAERAVGALAPLAEGSEDPELLADLAEGYTRLANTVGVPNSIHLNQFSRAKELLATAETLAKRATTARPKDPRSWMVLGGVYSSQASAAGQDGFVDCLRRAVECYSAAFGLMESRLDTPETKAVAKRLAYATGHLATARSALSNTVEEFAPAFDMYDRLIAAYPDDMEIGQSRAVSQRCYGARLRTSRPGEARQALLSAAKVFERHLAENPDDYSSARNLALSRAELGYLLGDEGRWAEALAMVDSAADLVERWSRADPANTLRRDDRLDSEEWRGTVRLSAASAVAVSPAERDRYIAETSPRLEAAIQEAKSLQKDPSPRDEFRLKRLEAVLAKCQALGAPTDMARPEQ